MYIKNIYNRNIKNISTTIFYPFFFLSNHINNITGEITK